MPAYKFRLATLMKLRESVRDERRAFLAEAYEAERILLERLHEVEETLSALRNGLRSAMGPGTIDVDRLIESQRYELMLKAHVSQMNQQRKMLEEEIERRRQALMLADRDVRVLEKLRERQLEEHRQQENLQEIKRLDEVGSRRRLGEADL